MVTWKSSPPAFSWPIRYFLLDSDALWVTSKERGVLALKKERRISRACFLEQLRVDEITVTSIFSANQLERELTSPYGGKNGKLPVRVLRLCCGSHQETHQHQQYA